MLRQEVTCARGGLLARMLDAAVNLLRGRKLRECGRCFGTGIECAARSEQSGIIRVLTTCRRCEGVGEVWR